MCAPSDLLTEYYRYAGGHTTRPYPASDPVLKKLHRMAIRHREPRMHRTLLPGTMTSSGSSRHNDLALVPIAPIGAIGRPPCKEDDWIPSGV